MKCNDELTKEIKLLKKDEKEYKHKLKVKDQHI